MQKGRRNKVRYVQSMPETVQFSPRGKPGRPDEVELRIDQFEAIKLADFQGYDQTEGAKCMGISRPSFGRILRQGRKIIADALVNSKIIRIRIGSVQVGVRKKSASRKDDVGIGNVESGQAIEQRIRKKIFEFDSKDSEKLI